LYSKSPRGKSTVTALLTGKNKNMKNKIIAELAQGFEGDLVKAKLLVNAERQLFL